MPHAWYPNQHLTQIGTLKVDSSYLNGSMLESVYCPLFEMTLQTGKAQ